MRSRFALVLTLLLCNFSYNKTYGFEASGNFWELGKATYHVGITGSAPSGVSWNTSFKRAMASWSDSSNFKFLAIDSFKDPCSGRQNGGFGDNMSSVNFTLDVCGNAFGTNTLAITLTAGICLNPQCTGGFKILDADVLFSRGENWDVYTGPRRPGSVDFERVALHELGHALGLRHESSKPAIMQPLVADTHTLQIDDINGANAIYPGTGNPAPIIAISTIYGVNVVVPTASRIAGPNNNVTLTGALASGDFSLDGKFVDLYQFTFANDSVLDLRLNSTTIDPFLYLVRITSTQAGIPEYTFTDDNSGAGSNAQIIQFVQAGTYWVGASSAINNQQGSYELSLITANGNPPSSFQSFQSVYGASVQINPNPSITGSLSSSDFLLNGKRLDLYQFTVTSQRTLRFDLSSTAFDPVLIVARLQPNGVATAQVIDESFVLQNDNFGGSQNSRLEQRLAPGNYWIGVTSASTGQTGSYQIETIVGLP